MTTLLHSTIAKSDSASVLREVRNEDCNLAIWERTSIAGIEGLFLGSPDDVRFTASLNDLPDQLRKQLNMSGFTATSARDRLIADIVQLAAMYCSILATDALEIRLETVTTNACRKWHSDYVTARVITTYVGSGTDRLDAEDAARIEHGLGPTNINSLQPGDVGIFKGRLATNAPAIHRSPPIDGTGEKRLLLVLNPSAEV